MCAGLFAGCEKKTSTKDSSSESSVEEHSSVSTEESTTESESSAPSTSEPTTSAPEEDDSWHYGTVKRPEEVPYDGKTIFWNVRLNGDWWCYGSIPDLDIDGSNQEQKIGETFQTEFEKFKQEEITHIGSNVIEKIYPCHRIYSGYGSGETSIVNNILSIPLCREDIYETEEDAYDGPIYYKYHILNFNINTGEVMQLRDLFYEDVDYVTLLNDKINEWRFTHHDQEEIIPFDGITADQEFSIENDGSMRIYYADDEYMVLAPQEVVKITAIANAVVLDEPPQEMRLFMPNGKNDANPLSGATFEYKDLFGIAGTNETRTIVRFGDVPDAVYQQLKTMDYQLFSKEDLEKLRAYFADGVTIETTVMVYCMGDYYNVEVEQKLLEDYSDSYPEDIQNLLTWKNLYPELLFDQEGNLVSVPDLFKEDVDVIDVLADAILVEREHWDDDEFSYTEFSEETIQILQNGSRTEIRKLLDKAQLTAGSVGVAVNFGVRYDFVLVEWTYLIDDLK